MTESVVLRAVDTMAIAVWIAAGSGCDALHDDDVGPGDDDGTVAPDDDAGDDDSSEADDDDDDTVPLPFNGCGVNRDGVRAAGTWIEPIDAPYLPFFDRNDTAVSSADLADAYDCAPELGEQGPELVYRFVTDEPGTFRAEVACDEPVDVDLHLLVEPEIVEGLATGCIDRAHIELVVEDLPAGEYWLVADSWSEDGVEYDGPYALSFEWTVDGVWSDVQVEPGVVWSRLRSGDLYGGDQTIDLLTVDPTAGVDLQPALHDGCRTVAAVAAELDAFAGINAGFFAGGCAALDMVKADGVLLATNAVTGTAQRTLGWLPGEVPSLAWIDAGADWAEVSDALGSYPSLVTEGAVAVEPSGADGFFTSRHPRTAMGLDAGGQLLLLTADGRTAAGDGLTTDQLAQLMIELGAVDAVNLDGGGSTTMAVRECWVGDVVNHPSDNGDADHHGERAVSDGLYLR